VKFQPYILNEKPTNHNNEEGRFLAYLKIQWQGFGLSGAGLLAGFSCSLRNFRAKGILLSELTHKDIDDFYDVQLERVTAMTVTKFHANISLALKYAFPKGYIPSYEAVMKKVTRPTPDRYTGKFLKESETVVLVNARATDWNWESCWELFTASEGRNSWVCVGSQSILKPTPSRLNIL
jgi:hypothetical protein